MTLSQTEIWLIIIILGAGTFLIRFSFVGFLGSKELPEWFLRHLNYVGVAVMPALVAPMILWPEATGGVLDPPRLIAAITALAVGIWRKSAIAAVVTGFVVLYAGLYFF